MNFTAEQERNIGEVIAILFRLEPENGQYMTAWGWKTSIGLYHMFKAIQENIDDRSILKTG